VREVARFQEGVCSRFCLLLPVLREGLDGPWNLLGLGYEVVNLFFAVLGLVCVFLSALRLRRIAWIHSLPQAPRWSLAFYVLVALVFLGAGANFLVRAFTD
jgi:hypothetical protein